MPGCPNRPSSRSWRRRSPRARSSAPAHDKELIAGFLDRIEHELDAHIDERIAARTPAKRRASVVHPGNLALCIPIIAVAGGVGGGLAGVVVAVVALVIVFVYAETNR